MSSSTYIKSIICTLSGVVDSTENAVDRHPIVISLAVLYVAHRLWRQRRRRSRTLPRSQERVLVVGASSGIGRSIAHEYATAGARVCIVGRRDHQLNAVAEECANLLPGEAADGAGGKRGSSGDVLPVVADFTNADDMVALREKLEERWGGLDTLVVCAGVSALRPLLEVAGLDRHDGKFSPPQVSVAGVQRTVEVACAAMHGNYIGPLVCAVTFIPLLSLTSTAPSVLLMSSLAAVVPAPTRSLYTSTKASSLLLYQSLAIEHPSIKFTFILPSTVEGDFRASAVDGGTVREADPNKNGLKRTTVARRSILAVDRGEKLVFMPPVTGRFAHLCYWVFPSFIEVLAARKYNFTAV
ncbi:NAD(P)-binding protein [Dichomitus squalens LYAD-421 SS1]|uniref:NAD(P)-binding protein n=1 Tax=Dichomitus squalens (strain LYAD-421) TaxID=732165 RepID=UPI0004411761|nr:NAD(P)-binding protein [Dichomitus squalens LYAD-421 SS1]EJF64609.1 NAD(P)-binding protein [Dichomitus squalens LYAD-421 SS1]